MLLANASLPDEATAAAEVTTPAQREPEIKSKRFVVASDCHPDHFIG